MKATVKTEKQFTPITLNITFETGEEIGKLYAIMNYTTIVDAARFHDEAYTIREAIRNGCDNTFSQEVYHSQLRNAIG